MTSGPSTLFSENPFLLSPIELTPAKLKGSLPTFINGGISFLAKEPPETIQYDPILTN